MSGLSKASAAAFGEELAQIVKAANAPLIRRIETLENEVRAGHERIKVLEAARDADRAE